MLFFGVCHTVEILYDTGGTAKMKSELKDLEGKKEKLVRSLRELGDMRRGSVAERYIPCGKPGCRCTKPGQKGHGPNYSLTWKEHGKTRTRYIAAKDVRRVREQIRAKHQFDAICREIVAVSEQISDRRLQPSDTESSDGKKNSRKL